jgi:hypothetical protein
MHEVKEKGFEGFNKIYRLTSSSATLPLSTLSTTTLSEIYLKEEG